MEIFNELIGGQILEMENNSFVVRLKNGQTRNFILVEDEGDCCGYNVLQTELFYSEGSKDNPAIVKIEYESNDDDEGDSLTITFFGAYAPLAKINSFSYSGSGWGYGATVSVVCRETKQEECLTSW